MSSIVMSFFSFAVVVTLLITQKHLLYLHETLLFRDAWCCADGLTAAGFIILMTIHWTDILLCVSLFPIGGRSDVASPNLCFAIPSTA